MPLIPSQCGTLQQTPDHVWEGGGAPPPRGALPSAEPRPSARPRGPGARGPTARFTGAAGA
eukprot:83638-Chlamydomonas_euryale.AAC.1